MKNLGRHISLVELIFVLIILVLLTGISSNLYPDVERKTQLVKNISNLEKMHEASLLFEAQTSGALPDDFDSLLDTSGSLNPALLNTGPLNTLIPRDLGDISDVLDGVIGAPIGALEVFDELQNRGVTQIRRTQGVGISHETFNVGNPQSLFVGSILCTINENPPGSFVLETLFNITDTTNKIYLCVGIGSSCSLIGTPGLGVNFAPAYLPDVSAQNSISIESHYFRFVNIYEMSLVTLTNGTSYINIRFLGTVRPNDLDSASSPAPGNFPFISIPADYEKLAIENY